MFMLCPQLSILYCMKCSMLHVQHCATLFLIYLELNFRRFIATNSITRLKLSPEIWIAGWQPQHKKTWFATTVSLALNHEGSFMISFTVLSKIDNLNVYFTAVNKVRKSNITTPLTVLGPVYVVSEPWTAHILVKGIMASYIDIYSI